MARNDSSRPVTVQLYDGSDLVTFAEVPPDDVYGFAIEGCQGTEIRVLDAVGERLAVVQRAACQDKQIVISADLQVRYENYRRPET